MAPGVSVSTHDLNTNQVFKWCRELRSAKQEREVTSPELLLVSLTPPEVPKPVSPAESRQDGRIELHLKRERMLLTGEINTEMLHAVLDRLLA